MPETKRIVLSGKFVVGESDMEHAIGEVYEIKIKELLDPAWSEWFNDFTIRKSEDQETIITGRVRDQTALHGLLAKIRNMNLTLISVMKVSDEVEP